MPSKHSKLGPYTTGPVDLYRCPADNGACGFCFADGHAEIHKWREASTLVKVTKRMHNADYPTRRQYRDMDWMIEHSTAKRVGQ